MITAHIMKHTNNIVTSWCGGQDLHIPDYRDIDAAILGFGKKQPFGPDYRPCEDCLRAARSSIDVILNKEYPVEYDYSVKIHMVTHDADDKNIINANCTVNSVDIPNVTARWVDHPDTVISRRKAIEEAAIRKYQEVTRSIE